MKMHAGEVEINGELVRQLVAAQFPSLAGLPIREALTSGTMNAIYRLGDQLYARLPRLPAWAEDLERELAWLPRLVPHLSLPVPEPIARGAGTRAYPFPWAIYRWIAGHPYRDQLVLDEQQAAGDLARFVAELRRADPRGAPRAGRRPLDELDAATRAAIAAARGLIDGDAAIEAWEKALQAPAWAGEPVWIHADLLRPNLLVAGGRLRAVIDFGSAGVGDPAADVIPAWTVFNGNGRKTFRRALDVDDGTWARARGYALHQAALIIPYYIKTNPAFAQSARRTVEQVLADTGG